MNVPHHQKSSIRELKHLNYHFHWSGYLKLRTWSLFGRFLVISQQLPGLLVLLVCANLEKSGFSVQAVH